MCIWTESKIKRKERTANFLVKWKIYETWHCLFTETLEVKNARKLQPHEFKEITTLLRGPDKWATNPTSRKYRIMR